MPAPDNFSWPSHMLQLGSSPRILITRLSAIGDCIHTLPLASALRRHFPSAFIAWATQAGPATIIEGHFALDTVIRVDRRWMKSLSSMRAMRRELKAHRFDLVLDPQSLTKSALLGWLAHAQHRIGFARGQGRELAPLLATTRVTPRCDHVIARYLELLSPLGIDTDPVEFAVPRFPESEQRMGDASARFALLNPGAGWNSKRWPHLRYAEVARHLRDQHGLNSTVLWAGDEEKHWADMIVAAARGAAVLAPPTSLPDLATLCRRATLFVGSDTGPLHLAAAVDTPCVAMYGPTKISECGPFGSIHEALQVRYQGGNSKARRGDDNRAMRAISVASVCLACDRLLQRRHRAA